MPYYYGFDWTYLVIVLPCILLSMWASSSVNSTFQKYAKVNSIRRLTGAEAAQRVLSANGVRGVRIERVSGNLTDHYDPKTNVIRLSDSVYSSTSVFAYVNSDTGLKFNKSGKSYGTVYDAITVPDEPLSVNEPDLIYVLATNGKYGYAKKKICMLVDQLHQTILSGTKEFLATKITTKLMFSILMELPK